MARPKYEPSTTENLVNVRMTNGIAHGVAVTWTEGADERIISCGTEENARLYLDKTLAKDPFIAELVKRDVIQVYGPWESA